MADSNGLAWTRKYRPKSFADYMGDDVKNLVVNRFRDPDNFPQTIMLYGTRGTGKTSMARLMCKEIHCENKVDGHACGQCEMCQMIDEYISSTEAGATCDGIVEVDAATTTGKNDINDIIEELIQPPLYPLKHTVCILDECHKLSNSAQNSLLKVIEEPPPHLVFILCTTDPDDVISTIHSRMQLKIEVRKKTVDELAQRLMWIGEQEGLQISLEACQLIAKKKDRIPRDSIMLLETVAKNYGHVLIKDVLAAVQDVSTDIFFKFFVFRCSFPVLIKIVLRSDYNFFLNSIISNLVAYNNKSIIQVIALNGMDTAYFINCPFRKHPAFCTMIPLFFYSLDFDIVQRFVLFTDPVPCISGRHSYQLNFFFFSVHQVIKLFEICH